MNAAVAAAGVCDDSVAKLVGSGFETQFKFRGALQEEKPLRDWIQEILMNCLGYYTFAFGKLKLGVRVNSSAVEAFTAGNILYRSLQLEPARPSFNHLTANFADADFNFANNSVTLYDIDHAALVGVTRPLFLKSDMNLAGASSKSQAARLVTVRLREELGGITAEEWKRARNIAFRTTVLALNVEPGMVCSMTHPDMPTGAGEFRVISWRLNKDFSIDIQGRTTTDSMYDLVSGPKPADVEASPVTLEPENPVPSDIQAIGADPFLLTESHDGKTATLSVEYDPPALFGVFAGVTAHVEAPDGTGQIALSNDYWYNGNPLAPAGDAARHGTFQIKLPQPAAADQTWRVYLTPRSRAYAVPLVLHGGMGESVNRTVLIAKAVSGAGTPPALPSSVTMAEDHRWLKTDNQTGWGTMLVTVSLPDAPTAKEWVSLWFSFDDGATWEGASREFPIAATPQSFYVDLPVPAADQTWRVKATTSDPNGINSPADAVVSASLAVAGIAPPLATIVTNSVITDLRSGATSEGVPLWGCTISAEIAAFDPNFWFAFWTRQYCDAAGNPDPARPEEIHGNEFTRTNGTVTDYGGLDQPMPGSDTYKYVKHRWYVRNRNGQDTLQTNAFGAGVSERIDSLTVPAGALRVDRGDASRMLGLHVSGGKLQPKTGNGLVISGSDLIANIGGVLGFSGGQIQVSIGNGLVNSAGSLYASVAQGLGFDVSGRIQIPTNGIGQSLLSNSQIIDAARLVNYAVSQMKLQNAQIIDSARIVDLAVLTGKIGLLQVGAAQIADLAVTSAKINDLSVAKLTAGTATFTGDLTFQNTGSINLWNGGDVSVSPGWMRARHIGTNMSVTEGNWEIQPGSVAPMVINTLAGSYVQAGYFKISQGGGSTLTGQTVTVIYKQADGVTNGYLYFNGGILTSYS